MTKHEINETISQVKKELVVFQKKAKELGFEDEMIQAQIDHYLDTLNKLKELLKKTTD